MSLIFQPIHPINKPGSGFPSPPANGPNDFHTVPRIQPMTGKLTPGHQLLVDLNRQAFTLQFQLFDQTANMEPLIKLHNISIQRNLHNSSPHYPFSKHKNRLY
jgi:hypothetical protein